jgi:simple sugar transport system permease protein
MNSKIVQYAKSSEAIVLYFIVALCLTIGLMNHTFFSPSTVVSLSRTIMITLTFAICETVIIISGGIDVSFPAVATIAFYATAKVAVTTGIDNLVVLFAIGAAIGALFGVVNALLIAKFNVPPLIATLGVSSVANGATLAFLGTNIIASMPPSLDKLAESKLFTYTSGNGMTYSVSGIILLPIAVCVLAWLILRHTSFGRSVYAIGGDAKAARVVGINVTGVRFAVYILCGAIVGIAGVAYMAFAQQADPNVLMGSEMLIIAAVVVGGTRITGGYGGIFGTILGVVLIALIQNNLIMVGVPAEWQTFVVGLVILLGSSLTSIRAKALDDGPKI